MMKRKIIYAAFLLLTGTFLHAQIDTLKAGETYLNFKKLMPQTYQCMMYNVKGANFSPVDIVWSRTVEFNKVNGEEVIQIKQQLYARDSLQNFTKVSFLRLSSFTPISHVSENAVTRVTTQFNGTKVSLTLDSLQTGNTKKMEADLKMAGYDFEADEELFSLLPLRENYKVAIPFYQPGSARLTRYYLFEVTGTELIHLPGGATIECWKLQSLYTGGMSTWWISKKNQEFIKQKREKSDGSFSYKVRLVSDN